MGYLIKKPNEVVTFKRTLTPTDILSTGLFGNYIPLNIPVYLDNNSYFLPINFLIVYASGTINYDFPAGGHPVIIYNFTQQYCFFGKELINNWQTFFINSSSSTHNLIGTNYTTETPIVSPTITGTIDLFFGTVGGNANVGDKIFDIHITGSYITL
jgi:hypothetical protein